MWRTQARVLCTVGPNPGAEHVVRSAARLAGLLDVEWIAAYVETPKLQRLPAIERERILRVVKLASELGARTTILTGSNAVNTLVAYAREQNISTVVVGRRAQRGWTWRQSISDAIAAADDNLDVLEIGRGVRESGMPIPESTEAYEEASSPKSAERRWRYAGTVLACIATTAAASLLLPHFDLANIVMLFLLAVVLVGVEWGRGPAILAAILNVAAFDFFFVPPIFTFAVSDMQYLLTFSVMLAVGLITGQMTAGMRFQARIAQYREERMRTLYEFARDLSGLLTTAQVIEVAEQFMSRAFRARVSILVPGAGGALVSPTARGLNNPADRVTAQWAYDRAQEAGAGTATLSSNEHLFLPLKAPMRTRGVLAIQPERTRDLLIPEQRRQHETFAALVAIALERVHYVEVARDALVRMESERLRNSLLAALSHDLRTPLAALLGLAESLALTRPPMSPEQAQIASAIGAQTRRLIALVNNILDMARIQSGEVRLDRQWHLIEEVIGSAIRSIEPALAKHRLAIDAPEDLPLVEMDAVLIERVLVNLLENAAKFAPGATVIEIEARAEGERLRVAVSDAGPGVRAGQEEAIFEKFTRGEKESATPGVGLGLAICRAIVEAHGGEIHLDRGRPHGARFVFTLPLGTPPAVEPAAP